MRRVVTTWAPEDEPLARRPRSAVVVEREADDGSFEQVEGPFESYRREVRREGERLVDETSYRLTIPWFRWVFALPMRWALKHRPRTQDSSRGSRRSGSRGGRRPIGSTRRRCSCSASSLPRRCRPPS